MSGPASLVVLHDAVAGESGSWGPLVDDLARALFLVPAYTPIDMHGIEWVDRLLQVSAGVAGPVLVLPRTAASAGTGAGRPVEGTRHLSRVVVASGDAPDVVQGAGRLARHLRRGGVRTTVLVVLANGAVPSMWEGPGHHAEAWRDELHRRHGGAESVEVLPGVGPTGSSISAHAEDADLLVLLWHRVATVGRALVARSVLGQATGVPCLLVPISWLATLQRRREPVTVAGEGASSR